MGHGDWHFDPFQEDRIKNTKFSPKNAFYSELFAKFALRMTINRKLNPLKPEQYRRGNRTNGY